MQYPLRLRGQFDPSTSRWLWIIKWLTVIPHVFVLAFLWIAAFAMTIVAGCAILITGRFPRRIFDFNVGVIRWTWRVSFYAIGAFGTDRYPPFSLGADSQYPADLDVDYPDQLSRALVLVKWWLLAIPQYLVVAVFAGGWNAARQGMPTYGLGLIGILALVGAVAMLFTASYPRSIFDFVIGLNRWCFRVLAYVMLLTDEYPPFRLDMGALEPA
jgi:hypothetical protein